MAGNRNAAWRRGLVACSAVLTLTLAAGAGRSDPPPAAGDAQPVRPVTVTALADRKAVEHKVRVFVGNISGPSQGESLVRWRVPICPLVAGRIDPDQARFVLARISENARGAGAKIDGPQCRPNLYIVFTNDSDGLLKLWRKHDRGLFGGQLTARINRFLAKRRPVRVWYNSYLADSDTVALSADASENMGAPTNRHGKDTRIGLSTVHNLQTTIVIVDVSEMKGVTFGSLSDYVTMVALTEVDQDADLGGAPSILRLFDGSSDAPTALTAWDKAFLSALHQTRQASRLQRSMIADRMAQGLTR